jgi:hypothetical protein
MGHSHHKHICYQISYFREHDEVFFNKAHQLIAKNWKIILRITKKLSSVGSLYFSQEIREGSTTILQYWSQIGQFQSMTFPCEWQTSTWRQWARKMSIEGMFMAHQFHPSPRAITTETVGLILPGSFTLRWAVVYFSNVNIFSSGC